MSGNLQPSAELLAEETQRFHLLENAQKKEDEYVHDVYNQIAQHFSKTRYKPWPIVSEFLSTQIPYSLGLDVGCGNGKYLDVNPELYIIGSDFSTGLINQAQILHKDQKCCDTMVADGLHLPHHSNRFDFAISIAVIHHFSNKDRRVEAIVEILRTLKKGGKALIYCWALEQEKSRRGYHEGMDQDVLVPWVLAQNQPKKKKKQRRRGETDPKEEEDEEELNEQVETKPETKMRFYHLYKKGELAEDCELAGGRLFKEGYEKDNWWIIIEKI